MLDKAGNEISIDFYKSIVTTPIIPIFLREYAKLVESGFALNFLVGTNKSAAVYATHNDKIVGFIIFDYLDDAVKTAWIIFGWIDDNYRKNGIYKLLHDRLEAVAKASGSRRVSSLIHVNNTAMIAVSEKLGKKPNFYRSDKEI